MMDAAEFHDLLRRSHIFAGAIGLLLFWVPVFSKKGSRVHTLSGKVFAWLAYFVALTAAVSCGWALVSPISFTGIERPLSEQETKVLSSNIRFFFSILGTLMTWLVAAVQLGVYCMRTKGGEDQTKTRVMAFQMLAGLASVALLGFGVMQWFSGAGPRSFAAIGLGYFGVSDTRQTLRYFSDASPKEKSWWFMHMECMLGAGIAFYTAFTVFGFSRLFNVQLQGIWSIAPWLIPAGIGVPATKWWIGRYRKRFDAKSTSVSDTARRFASALDQEDYVGARALLHENCVYELRGETITGAGAIIESYRSNGDAGNEAFDKIEYESSVAPVSSNSATITFVDHLSRGSRQMTFRSEQHVETDKQNLLTKIRHVDLPGQVEALQQFKQNGSSTE